jgi:hypothetical protein
MGHFHATAQPTAAPRSGSRRPKRTFVGPCRCSVAAHRLGVAPHGSYGVRGALNGPTSCRLPALQGCEYVQERGQRRPSSHYCRGKKQKQERRLRSQRSPRERRTLPFRQSAGMARQLNKVALALAAVAVAMLAGITHIASRYPRSRYIPAVPPPARICATCSPSPADGCPRRGAELCTVYGI